MIRYHQQVCHHCQGTGLVRRQEMHEQTCPLCFGRGRINDFDHPIDEEGEQRPPPTQTSVALLARVVPLGGATSGKLLFKRHVARRPQGLPIYQDGGKGCGRHGPSAA
jgi:hypothetical protein